MDSDRAVEWLRRVVDPSAGFRPGQLEAVTALVEDRRRVLVVQRTGWGKSAVYVVATMLLREQGAGPTLLVSPLLSLMRDQIEHAEQGGVRAATINSANKDDWDEVITRLVAGEVDILLVAPERLANLRFADEVLPQLAHAVGLLVIDEAHCISDWGHDFRPDYRRIVRVLDLLPTGVPVLCTTATANNRVIADVGHQLGEDPLILRGNLDRESLALDVVDLPSQSQRLAWLARVIPQLPGSGFVYTLTTNDAQQVADWLRSQGIDAEAYYGDVETEKKVEIERRLQTNDVKVVVATTALGMGYDKPDLAFVIHFQVPGSVIAYYQQVGRAGRALDHALAIALRGHEDQQIQDYFIRTAFPEQRLAEQVVALLDERADWTPRRDLLAEVNIRQGRLDAMLKIFEVDGVVERDATMYRRTLAPWSYPTERYQAITDERRREQAAMLEYLDTSGCLMEHLRRALDDPDAAPCGRCSRCLGHPLVAYTPDVALARAATRFLRGQQLPIEPRKQWASLQRIPAEQRAEVGRALSVYGDGGWGELVKAQKPEGHFADELIEALAELTAEWRPDPAPTWITSVPSLREPMLVQSVAERLAARLGLPFRAAVHKERETEPQKKMENSQQQAANLDGAFVVQQPIPDGPVLLVDDIYDSGWTVTLIAASLREAGSGPVFPLVLARAIAT